MSAAAGKRICLGAFAGAHGVRGQTRLKCFTATPEAIAAYGAVETEDGAYRFSLKFIRVLKGDIILASAPEIKTREDAEALKGTRLYIDRDALPAAPEDEFYIEDLIGLTAIDEDGASAGRVGAVHNFGAGDLIELRNIPGLKGVRLIGFTREDVPAVDIAAGKIVIRRGAIDPEDPKSTPAGKG